MKSVEVFDPAMCCSTGVCGPSVDPDLAGFAASLAWLLRQGVAVVRFNLGQQPQEFASRAMVLQELTESTDTLPLVLVDGEIRSRGRYPSRAELAAWCGVAAPAPVAGLSLVGE